MKLSGGNYDGAGGAPHPSWGRSLYRTRPIGHGDFPVVNLINYGKFSTIYGDVKVQANIEIKDKTVMKHLTKLQKRARDATELFAFIGEHVRFSVLRNFEEGGYPEKWQATKVRSIYYE